MMRLSAIIHSLAKLRHLVKSSSSQESFVSKRWLQKSDPEFPASGFLFSQLIMQKLAIQRSKYEKWQYYKLLSVCQYHTSDGTKMPAGKLSFSRCIFVIDMISAVLSFVSGLNSNIPTPAYSYLIILGYCWK
mgnify:FL=1